MIACQAVIGFNRNRICQIGFIQALCLALLLVSGGEALSVAAQAGEAAPLDAFPPIEDDDELVVEFETAADATPAEAAQKAPEPDAALQTYNTGALSFREDRSAARQRTTVSPPGFLAQLVAYAVVLGALLWGGLVAAKKWLPGSGQLFASPALEILGRTHLDPQRYLALVRVGRRVVVVGVTPERVDAVAELSDEAEVTEILEVARPKSEAGLSVFQKLFESQVEKQERDEVAIAQRDAALAARESLGELARNVTKEPSA